MSPASLISMVACRNCENFSKGYRRITLRISRLIKFGIWGRPSLGPFRGLPENGIV